MISCHNCVMCDWLENQSYCIKNKQYSKEDYQKYTKEILNNKHNFWNFYANVNNKWNNYWCIDTQWEFMLKSQNIQNWYYGLEIKNWKNLLSVGWSKLNTDMYDCFEAWAHGNSDFFWVMNAWVKSSNVYNCEWVVACNNIYYSRFLENCNYCIWCIGLKNKEFCILNKQYTKEERFEKADQIFNQMDQNNILWKYFPATLNPFYFNDTMAYLVWNFTKEEVEAEWYLRRDEEVKVDIPQWMETIKATELDQYQWFDSEWNWKIEPEILKKVIVDEKGNSYRIIKMEYDFLMKYWLPLPELHWLDRIKLGFKFK
jgi:pentatricopeptide repeat protein